MNITPHFTFEELTTTNHQELLEKNRAVAQQSPTDMWHLALFAEQVRAILNVPIRITSGFRCEELNNAVVGCKTSQHKLFQALDIIPVGMDIEDAYEELVDSDMLYGQLILEKGTWIHISMGYKRENLICRKTKYTKYMGE